MKNGAHELKRRPYDVELNPWVAELTESYIEEFRPVLLKGVASQYLFVPGPSPRPWNNLDGCGFDLTKQFIPGLPRFRTAKRQTSCGDGLAYQKPRRLSYGG
jgi:hypothetical protein